MKETGNEKKIAMIQALFLSELKQDINTLAILDRGVKISFSDGTIVHIQSFNDADYKVKQLEEIRKEMKLKDETYREIYLDQGDHPVAVRPSSMDEDLNKEEADEDLEKRESISQNGKKSENSTKKGEERHKKGSQKGEPEVDTEQEKETEKEVKAR